MLYTIYMAQIEQFASGERHRFSFKRWVTDPAHKTKVDALRSTIQVYISQQHSKPVCGPHLSAYVYSKPAMKKLLDGLVIDGHIDRDDIEAVPTLLLEWDLILIPNEIWIRDFAAKQRPLRGAEVEAFYWKQ